MVMCIGGNFDGNGGNFATYLPSPAQFLKRRGARALDEQSQKMSRVARS